VKTTIEFKRRHSIRRECLDHVTVFSERHLRRGPLVVTRTTSHYVRRKEAYTGSFRIRGSCGIAPTLKGQRSMSCLLKRQSAPTLNADNSPLFTSLQIVER
jgi:hypothetical protein